MSQQDFSLNKNGSEINQSELRYCICQKREEELYDQNNENDFMIECDGCNGWFHGRCVSLADRIADDIEKYFCNECSKKYGPSIFKQRKNQHRRDFSDPDAKDKLVQSGTKEFINQLKRRTFLNCDSIITKLKGNQLTIDYLKQNGFTKPILIPNRDGLELVLPSRTITLQEINELVGHDCDVDIIDCEKQVTYKMKLDEFVQYFESYDRNKIYNVLSLEISQTKLGEMIKIPKIVEDLSWDTTGIWPNKKKDDKFESDIETKKTTWSSQTFLLKNKRRILSSITDSDPSDDDDDEDRKENHFENFQRPEVSKYCLMSPQSSYTDFHIDFGGSSVWYSVIRGEKIFYLIEPTDENLQKYANWSKSSNESEIFLGDLVSHCYKMHLREENTVFIPAGWIHAVYTVTDSLVFGGNFLQSIGVDMQLRIYELESLAQVPLKFKYPLFETFHWYAAKHFYEELRKCNNENSSTISSITRQASESIICYISRWLTANKRYQIQNRYIIPKDIHCEKLLRDLSRELEIAKTRCGLFNDSNISSKTIITNSNIHPIENKRDFVQIGKNKIKIKCHRLSSSDLDISNKNIESIITHGVKLNVKTTINEDRKETHNESLSSVKQKKNRLEQDNSSKMTHRFDLEAKRKRLIQVSNIQSVVKKDGSKNDKNISSISSNLPAAAADDDTESHDNNEVFSTLANSDLASFVQNSMTIDAYNKNNVIKHEQRSTEKKDSIPKKFKMKLSNTDNNLTKKIKLEPTKSAEGTNKSKIVSSSTNRQHLSCSSIKNVHSTDRLKKILKLANSIKSRGAILT